MMKKLLIMAAVVAAALSCSEGVEESVTPQDQPNSDLATVSLTASLSSDDATRVAVSSTEGYKWSFKWEEGDQLWFMDSSWTGYTLTTSGDNFDESYATFSGTVPTTGEYYLLGGLSDFINIMDEGFDLSKQYGTMAEIPIISTEQINMAELTSGEVSSVEMEHLGAFVKINIDFGSLSGYTLSTAYLTNMNCYLEGSMISSYGAPDPDSEYYYDRFHYGNIAVTLPAPVVASGEHSIPVAIFPTKIEVGGSLSVVLALESESGEQKFVVCTKSPESDSYEFARATVNTIGVSVGADDLFSLEGEGTEANPYIISTAEDLNNMSALINAGFFSDKCFEMSGDIDLEGSADNLFTPIGTSSSAFSGTFNGAGHNITNIYIDSPIQYTALFGYTSYATIQNVTVSGYVSNANSYNNATGGIVGEAYFSTIINCCNKASISGYYMVGGICGEAQCSSIINCCNLGSIYNYSSNTANVSTARATYTGGICGYEFLDCEIINCYNGGAVTANQTSPTYLGTIAGCVYALSTSYSCTIQAYNDIDVSVETDGYNIYYGATYVTATVTDYSTTYMQSAEFVSELNSGLDSYSSTYPDMRTWKYVADDYPAFTPMGE